tara:strand:+ start:196 stop:540 length:345 start_codon:yes stop_codon:yes gene_type:complete
LPARFFTFLTGFGASLTVLMVVFCKFITTGLAYADAILNETLNILITRGQDLVQGTADLSTDTVCTYAVFHHFHIIFIQASVSAIVTGVDAFSQDVNQFFISHNQQFLLGFKVT